MEKRTNELLIEVDEAKAINKQDIERIKKLIKASKTKLRKKWILTA